MKKRKLLLLIFLIIAIVTVGTLAYFTVITDRTALVLVLGQKNEVLITLRPFEIKGTLMSTLDYTSFETNDINNDYIQITAENFSEEPKEVYFYYRINSIDSPLVSNATSYAITSSSSQNGTYTEVLKGNFSTAVSGNDLVVYKFTIPGETTIFYRVFTYLDGTQNVTAMSGATINAEFRAEIQHIIIPELDEGMIPVTIDNSGSNPVVKTIYADDEDWFNYEERKWANVVLVKEQNRSDYMNTSGITVDQSDILAYYVWIPRFEYRYTNLGTSYAGGSQSSPRAIAINFIPSHRTLPSSKDYMIHPAFTFGDINVSGFWVGKFETTGTTSNPTVLPLVSSLDEQNVSTLFQTSLKFNGGTLSNGSISFSGSNYYGTTNKFDSHMMKNSEWGAIAYLTQSIYGSCTSATNCVSVYPNNSGNYITGKGSGSSTLTWNSIGSFNWDDNPGLYSSTTQNITGVYDMSGGSYEQTMSVLHYNSDKNFIYTGSTSGTSGANSGFKGYIGDIFYNTAGYIDLPSQKYYDIYTTTSLSTACNGDPCYGHALSETSGWYNDPNSNFVTSTNPWLVRGGGMGTDTAGSTKGIFAIANSTGGSTKGATFRSVIMSSEGASTDDSGGSDSGGSSTAIAGAAMLINKANPASVTTYSEGNTAEMYTFNQPATPQLGATTDYRYIGSNPNNYITFNNETWRIIGVFDNKIKIIKDSALTNISWDYKQSGVGSSTSGLGSNDWVDSQLMYMLNPNDITANVAKKSGYTFDGTNVKDANSKIIYQKGCKPASTDGTAYTCTANTWSLNSTALSQVADVTYYLGGSSSYSGLSATDYYTFERGEVKYNAVRSTNWTGKVGLMYPSDYAYTFAYGVDDTCYSDGYNCDIGTPSPSWLFNSSYQWTLAPRSSSANGVFRVFSTGYVLHYSANGAYGVRPVVYLKSNIVLSGNGTNDANIYTIVS